MSPSSSAAALPQLAGQRLVTDGGLETDLIFHRGIDLPHFAAFPLLDSDDGRDVLARYFADYVDIARAAGAGILFETPTWRANSDWGALLGYDAAALRRVNADAVALLRRARDQCADEVPAALVVGMVGPRGDGYRPDRKLAADEAREYHRPQLAAFADAGADLAAAYTLSDVDEAIGIVQASRDVGLPVAVSFTVETDGRLPSGARLEDAITRVDAVAPASYFLVNCAHPSHVAAALPAPGDPGRAAGWVGRIAGVRVNASLRSHAELDEAPDLDDGDPRGLALDELALEARLPNATIRGGCCGTDARHVAAMWGAPAPAWPPAS
jgi:homocysteine S-methyltransferase